MGTSGSKQACTMRFGRDLCRRRTETSKGADTHCATGAMGGKGTATGKRPGCRVLFNGPGTSRRWSRGWFPLSGAQPSAMGLFAGPDAGGVSPRADRAINAERGLWSGRSEMGEKRDARVKNQWVLSCDRKDAS